MKLLELKRMGLSKACRRLIVTLMHRFHTDILHLDASGEHLRVLMPSAGNLSSCHMRDFMTTLTTETALTIRFAGYGTILTASTCGTGTE